MLDESFMDVTHENEENSKPDSFECEVSIYITYTSLFSSPFIA